MTTFSPENPRDHELGNRGHDVPDYCIHCKQPFMAHTNAECPTKDNRALGENYEQDMFDRATKDCENMTPTMIRRHLTQWERIFRLLPRNDKVRTLKMNLIRQKASLV